MEISGKTQSSINWRNWDKIKAYLAGFPAVIYAKMLQEFIDAGAKL